MPTQKQLENLNPCKPGETHNPNGRPPKFCNTIKKMPKGAQAKVYAILHAAMQCESKEEASSYIARQDLGEYGFVLQIASKSLLGKDGWHTLTDIMDRLFGRPKQQAEVELKDKTIQLVR